MPRVAAKQSREHLLGRIMLLETELVWRQLWIHRHSSGHTAVFNLCLAPTCVSIRQLLPKMGWKTRRRGGA